MVETSATHLPLSEAQFGIWFAHQCDPTRRLYYFAEYAEIAGDLDVALLSAALRQAVAETDALNVRVVEGARGSLYQLVQPSSDWTPTELDVSSEKDPHAAALAWMRDESSRPIDLSCDRLFNSAVIRLAPDRTYWYWGVHHIAMDGYGMALVIRRVCELYRALRRSAPTPAAWFGRLQDLVEEELAARASARHEYDRAYWAQQFADRPSLSALGSRSAVGADGTFEGVHATVKVAPSTVAGLRTVAARLGGGWTKFAIAAAGLYLHRVSNAGDVSLSLSIHRRLTQGAKRTPCTMANVLPVRLTLSPAMTLAGYAAHTFAKIDGALKHHIYRGERLRRDVDTTHRGLGYFGPLVNVVRADYGLRIDGVRAQIHNVSFPALEDFNIGFEDRGGNDLLLHVLGSSANHAAAEIDHHAERLGALVAALATADTEHGLAHVPYPTAGDASVPRLCLKTG